MGLPAAWAVIVGTVIGSGVFMNLPVVARRAGNPEWAVWIWLLGGILWIPQVLVLAEMGTAFPVQGGPYQFLQKAGSPFLGFLYTWTAFLTSDTPTLTIIALLAASAAAHFVPFFEDPVASRAFAAGLIFFLAWLQSRGVKLGSRVQVGLTILKLLPLAAVVAAGAWLWARGEGAPAPPPVPREDSVFQVVTAGVSTTLWAYAGFLNILYMSGEVKRPSRNLPLALIGSLVFVTLAYTAISFFSSILVPFEEITKVPPDGYLNPFSYMGLAPGLAEGLFNLAFLLSMVGVLNAVIMTQPRLEYAMAKEGLFFPVFGRLHPGTGTPRNSIFIQAGLAVVLFVLGDIESMLGYFTLSYVLQNALVYGAMFFLRGKEDYRPSFKVKGGFFWAGLAVLIQLYIAYGACRAFPVPALLACGGLILTGLPAYLHFKRRMRAPAA